METQQVIVHHGGESVTCDLTAWGQVAGELIERHGAWVPGVSRVEPIDPTTSEPPQAREPEVPITVQAEAEASPVTPANSTWTQQVHDAEAQARITGLNAALTEAGITDRSRDQLYATGTRMADVGYATQRGRAQAHAAKQDARDAAAGLIRQVEEERRTDRIVTAGDFGAGLALNGKLTFDGYRLQEQALRGLLGRLESPALRYVLGVRDRIANPGGDADTPADVVAGWKAADKAALLDTLQRECTRYASTPLRLRMRDGLGDIFATVAPTYGEADAPAVLPLVLDELPDGCKASVSYDPESTHWELRASVFTPTPVDLQAVGEPFQAYASFQSRDNGTRGWTGGGGVEILACLNASTLQALAQAIRRVHRSGILVDVKTFVRDATRAIQVLVQAWGQARTQALETAVQDDAQQLIPLEQVIPGFYRHLLTARRSELVGVLPGRTEAHAKGLALAYFGERRNPEQVTRADLAQGWTRYAQSQPLPVQRDAEAAIARWLAAPRPTPVAYAAA